MASKKNNVVEKKTNAFSPIDLLKGVVVMIDEQVDSIYAESKDPAPKILEALIKHKYPVLTYTEIPDSEQIDNLQNIAFVILDWNLLNLDLGVNDNQEVIPLPAGLKKEMEDSNIEFIKAFKKNSFCPIFIFSSESDSYIKKVLIKGGVYIKDSTASNNILVMPKSSVYDESTGSENLINVLTDWLKGTPSAYVIKKYEDSLKKGLNNLSWSFYEKFPDWPVVFWKTYKSDSIDMSSSLLDLMNNCLVSRISQTEFDETILEKEINLESVKEEVRNVMEAERIYYKSFDIGESIITGDLFLNKKDYLLVITPMCDCIARNGKKNSDLHYLFLIGKKKDNTSIKNEFLTTYGRIAESDTHTILFPVNKGIGIDFRFTNSGYIEYDDISQFTYIGRVNPPFITNIQQKYGSYIQRQGLPKIPKEAIF